MAHAHVLPDPSPATVEVIVNQAADEAMTSLLGKLHTFEGRSRFSTWAFKFAILQAATEVRRLQWQRREVELRDLDLHDPRPRHDSPEHHAEGNDLAGAVADAMRTVLTPYQRRIAIALLVDSVPIDVLARPPRDQPRSPLQDRPRRPDPTSRRAHRRGYLPQHSPTRSAPTHALQHPAGTP